MGFDAKNFGRVVICYSVAMLILVSLGLWILAVLFASILN